MMEGSKGERLKVAIAYSYDKSSTSLIMREYRFLR